MNFLILPNLTKEKGLEHAISVINALRDIGVTAILPEEYFNTFNHLTKVKFLPIDIAARESTFLVAVGGDGTMLNAAKIALKYNKAILGVNSGRLGYLTHLEPTELRMLNRVMTGDYIIDERIVLEATLQNNKKLYAINDIVISRGVINKVIDINLLCDGRPMIDYRADGVIIATPTGSTAYSLSAGGSVVDPTISSIIVTPICPHALANRSIIMSPSRVLTIIPSFTARNSEVYIAADGEESLRIEKDSEISVKISEKTVKFLRIDANNFYDIVNKKLKAY